MGELPPIDELLAIGIIIFLAIGLHEFAHAKVADMAGDPTPSIYGRVTLNLTNHFEPLGTIMIVITSLSGYGIGWGKPVPMNPGRMNNPRWDHFWAVAAGPLTNVLQAVFWAIMFNIAYAARFDAPDFLRLLVFHGIMINLSLALFNMIPLGPLDGHWLVGSFLPEPSRIRWYQFNRTTGSMLLLILIIGGQFTGFSVVGAIIWPPMEALLRFLIGDRMDWFLPILHR